MASINITTQHEHLWRSVAALAGTATTMSETPADAAIVLRKLLFPMTPRGLR